MTRLEKIIGCIPFLVEILIATIILSLVAYIVLVIDYNTNKKICKYLRKQVQKIK